LTSRHQFKDTNTSDSPFKNECREYYDGINGFEHLITISPFPLFFGVEYIMLMETLYRCVDGLFSAKSERFECAVCIFTSAC